MPNYTRNLNREEATLLNFSIDHTRTSAPGSPYTMYAASTGGVYKVVNSDEVISVQGDNY
ncbi:hypothetical protein [Stygiolobus caldivivus]|uniref:Uncharacterized protein n=1 Tax=Stygiolobus caldivivus TaxID=2824673 RepID=A0A8D5U6I4_9CREN|nr:hypothetical protein [Stygiolobus caldivivus]BCU69980.1 hypothetical protein KN1_12770 [Stygiolobus caldivivus]